MVYKYCTEKANFLLPIYEYRGVLAYCALSDVNRAI